MNTLEILKAKINLKTTVLKFRISIEELARKTRTQKGLDKFNERKLKRLRTFSFCI